MGRKLIVLISILFITACVPSGDEPQLEADLIGYVIENSNYGMLVISKEPQNFSDTGGVSEFYEAIMFANAPDDIEVGELVSVWIDGPVAESYPSQAKIGEIEIMPVDQPENAHLSVAEAIREALHIYGQNAAIRSIHFDADNDQWEVEFKDLMSEDIVKIDIEDY